ncbi:MAG: hypothetical protein AAB354_01535 [candidate division KSB1 bacterium]
MGQQQLFLIVAGVLIAGLAVVGGLNLFGSSTQQANQDALAQDLLTISSLSKSWCEKPAFIGGGGSKLTDFTLDKISWPKNAATGTFENDNGSYAVNGIPTATELKIVGTAKNGKALTITLTVDDKGKVSIALTGV